MLGIEQVPHMSNLNCCAISGSTTHLHRVSWCYRLGALPHQLLFRQATQVELLKVLDIEHCFWCVHYMHVFIFLGGCITYV